MYKSDLTVTNHSLIKTFMDGEGKGIMGAELYFFGEAHHLMGYSTFPSIRTVPSKARKADIRSPAGVLQGPDKDKGPLRQTAFSLFD